jgi:GTPase SAR1 family protein
LRPFIPNCPEDIYVIIVYECGIDFEKMKDEEHIQYWENLLNQSSKRTRQLEGSVILIGGKGSGRATLLHSFCEKSVQHSKQEIISYDYFNAYDNEDIESTSRVNVWSLDEETFPLFSQIVRDAAGEKVVSITTSNNDFIPC